MSRALPDPIITLTTDFGLADQYVAAVRGVILGINRRATIVDVSHGVQPQRILQAVFLTQAAWPLFPADAIHVAVVDPGVGTDRRALVVVTPQGRFVGPDNGVLSAALPEDARPSAERGLAATALPAGYQAFAITNRRYMREQVSATFHGRDVFAPAAAHLSLGVPAKELGEPVEEILAFPPLRARHCSDGTLQAQVVHIDNYGNVVTDARPEDLPNGAFTIELAAESVRGPVRTYAEATGLAALVESTGYLAVVLPGGDAAKRLGVQIGDVAVVRAGT